MVVLHFMCLVFIPFYMTSVQAAPRNIRSNENNSNILFYDDSNNRNLESLSDIEKLTNGLSQKIPSLENSKPNQKTSKSNNMKPINRFPYLDDMRQNWGILVNTTSLEDEEEESYKRPINIPKPTDYPIKSIIETGNKDSEAKPLLAATPSPSVVSGNSKFTVTSGVKETKVKPTSCDVAVVVCCMKNSNLENCFLANGCYRKLVASNACQKSEMRDILKKMKDYYS